MWRGEDVRMIKCGEDEKMWGWEEKMWRGEDVRMRRCEDERMWRWEDVKMRRCEDEKMWGWEDVNMREKLRYRPPLLEEPCAQKLSGKMQQLCKTSFKNGKLTASYQSVLRFVHSICLKWCACHEKVRPGNAKCCTCHAKSSQQTWRSNAPNATLLRKSPPWPPNISGEHVSYCACHAKCIFADHLQMSHACQHSCNCYKTRTRTFCSLFARCRIPCACHAKPHPNFHEWSETVSFFVHFTSTRASRHNGVHLFDISTSKNAPSLVCFVHFDFEMCFAPQRRAIFHLSSPQMAPHPPLLRAYFSTLRSHKSLEKQSEPRLYYLFARLHLLSSDPFSSLIFLLFSALTLPTSAFPSIHMSEVWLLNFLR